MKIAMTTTLLFLAACASTPPTRSTPRSEEEMRAEFMDSIDDTLIKLQIDAGYVWHRGNSDQIVEYGVPGTDERALRMDCQDGRLLIIAPANTNAAEGSRTTASFRTARRGLVSSRTLTPAIDPAS